MLVPDGSESALHQLISSDGPVTMNTDPTPGIRPFLGRPLVMFTMPPHATALFILTHGDSQGISTLCGIGSSPLVTEGGCRAVAGTAVPAPHLPHLADADAGKPIRLAVRMARAGPVVPLAADHP